MSTIRKRNIILTPFNDPRGIQNVVIWKVHPTTTVTFYEESSRDAILLAAKNTRYKIEGVKIFPDHSLAERNKRQLQIQQNEILLLESLLKKRKIDLSAVRNEDDQQYKTFVAYYRITLF
uniref:Uncharacterized protein n=1 Tax=Ditylenchus dipsaci TaxID=166011 RepID=A0A915ES82_9BILA